MTQLPSAARIGQNLQNIAEDVIDTASPWVARLARLGYAAKGIVYCLIGVLAFLAATHQSGGQTTGSRGALAALLNQPYGQVLLACIALGLSGYVVWCFIQAIEDPEHRGSDAKAVVGRVARFGRGLAYGSIVLAAASMISGKRGGGEERTEEWTAWVMSFPAGIVLVGLAGAGIIAYGLYQLYRAWHTKLDRQLDLSRLSYGWRRAAVAVARLGLAARGLVFLLVGGFFVIAAWTSNPAEAKGFGQALHYLETKPYGGALLAAVAAGLFAYGVYELIRARYRRIHVG